MNNFSKNLKYLIKLFPTNQEQLASYLNKNQTTISNWINEISTADVRDLIKIHEYFGISIDALVLTDLKNGKVVTNEHIEDFKRNGKVSGKNLGKVQAISKDWFQSDDQVKNVLNEPDTVLSWAVMGQLKQIDVKLDTLRVLAEKIDKKTP